MHRRYERINIPTEIIRTLVAIAETGSFSKAGDKLGLSQPAVSAQVKRLQSLVGGAVFDRIPGGVVPTELGKLVLSQSRRLLEANDQILLIGGSEIDSQPIKLGLSTLYVEEFLANERSHRFYDHMRLTVGHSLEISKAFSDGFLDVVCLLHPQQEIGKLTLEWQEEFVWVRSSKFVLSPGAPIPLICWADSPADLLIVQTLEKAGLAFRITFASSDHHARLSATAAGIGLMALPERLVPKPLVVAREHYLPSLVRVEGGIGVRPGVRIAKVKPILDVFEQLLPNTKRNAA